MENSGDYISREAAIKARGRSCDRDCAKCDFAIEGDSWCDGEVFVVDLLRIPAADVRPVARGTWIWKDDGEVVCSECNDLIAIVGNTEDLATVISSFNFCPNCGAWMETQPEEE